MAKTNNGGEGGERKKDDQILTVVLGLDMHCEGCANRIKKSVRSFQGVELVKGGDGELAILTVIGKVDPTKLRESVEKKTKKKVELISPAPPKKDNNNSNNKENNNNNNNKQGEKKGEDNKMAKEPPVTTAVMKLSLHCQGCIQKIKKTVTKTKGYLDLSFDEEKDQITVKGAMDMKALAKTLSVKLKKTVDIVPPKKEEEKKEKENAGGNSGKGKSGGGGDILIHYVQYGNPAVFGYGYGYPGEQFHPPSMFSDENPNACSVM